jgi:hypothetical protein
MAQNDGGEDKPGAETHDHVSDTKGDVNVDVAIEISVLAEDARPKMWTKRMLRLYAILTLGYLCIILQGFDGSLMGAINAMVRPYIIAISLQC